ncbi:MAG: lyase family protein, partial [Vicinamibacterales bacterium]
MRIRSMFHAALLLGITAVAACTAQDAPTVPVAAERQPAPASGPTRMERDLLGEKAVPADAYYGVQTARALDNFKISGIPINHYPGFIEAWAIVKLAAARANTEVGAMKPEVLAAIEKAADALMKGRYHDQFKV